MAEPVPEAPLQSTERGLEPQGKGWFVVNVAEATGLASPQFGAAAGFEGEQRFPQFGINVRILMPGQPNCMYHRESNQEVLLVLSGECLLIVEEQERPLRAGDFVYLPPNTAHVLVGAGAGPCAVVMAGTRSGSSVELLYPVSEAAARYGASVERETADPREAYAGATRETRPLGRIPWQAG